MVQSNNFRSRMVCHNDLLSRGWSVVITSGVTDGPKEVADGLSVTSFRTREASLNAGLLNVYSAIDIFCHFLLLMQDSIVCICMITFDFAFHTTILFKECLFNQQINTSRVRYQATRKFSLSTNPMLQPFPILFLKSIIRTSR